MKNYEILSGNTLVAIWQDNNLEVVNNALLPLYLRRISNADMWLETRAIDSHRSNSRLLKKAVRLAERDDISTVISVNGATITDNYWIRDIGSELTYDDVKFSDDFFSTLALKGQYRSFNFVTNRNHSPKSPEFTNIGSFEKCWKLRDGKWWMKKQATRGELFSELFICRLGIALGMNMAVYERDRDGVRSLDFTNSAEVNFEPAAAFMGDNEDYPDVIKKLQELCPVAIPDYVRMIFLDTICANPDRHTNNFGLLRDTDTGELLGLAPNFDNNLALISRDKPSMPNSNDTLVRYFNELTGEYPEFKALIPDISTEILQNVINELNMKVRTQEIIHMVMARYAMINKN